MAVDNIDLSGEIKAWKDAAYGKDVRAANVAAFEKIQGTVNETVQNVNQASSDASSASQNAQKAVNDIQSAIETATSKASEAAGSATAADTSKKAAASSAAAADNSKTQAAASAAEAKKIAQGLGDFDGTAAKVKATDTYGLVVSALGESTAQALIDAIANKVMNELINKNKIVNNLLATDASTVLAGTQGAALDKRLVAAENAVAQLNSEASARWNNATPKTLWINIIPSAINTEYKYQHNSLIGANMVSLAFESAVYDILILTGNGRVYGTAVANTFTDDPYWKSTIQASFYSNTGTVMFRILFKGSSQTFNNLALKAVTYLKIG